MSGPDQWMKSLTEALDNGVYEQMMELANPAVVSVEVKLGLQGLDELAALVERRRKRLIEELELGRASPGS